MPATRDASVPRITVDPSFVTVSQGDHLVFRYRYDGAAKPYVKELFTAKGVNVLLDSPADHVHHRGLMFALGVGQVSFWIEGDQAGRQIHRSFEPVAGSASAQGGAASFSEDIDWRGPDDRLVLTERRTIRLHPDVGVPVLLTWVSRLVPAPGAGDVTLTGEHYYGLGMRFVRSMDKIGRFVNAANAEGEVFRGEERLIAARWCAYLSEVDGRPVTVAMFDPPGNTRHPATWFTMSTPFAYLSATMKLHTEPLVLKQNTSLELCYGVALWDGHVDAERIEQTCRAWLNDTAVDTGTKSAPKP